MKKRGAVLRWIFFLLIVATAISIFAQEGAEDTTNWDKQIDAAGGIDYVTSIAIDSRDNIFVVGNSQNQFAGTSANWWIKKFSPSGVENTTHWNLAYPNGTAWDIAIDQNDSLYVVGYGYDLVGSLSEEDWWVKKFYPNGTQYNLTEGWNKVFEGSEGDDQARAVEISPDNMIYVAGYGTDNIPAGEVGEDWWIKKFNSSSYEFTSGEGWNKIFNNSNGYFDRATAIAFDENNTLYVAGTANNVYSATSGLDWIIKKFNYSGYEYKDTDGWNKTINGNLGVTMIVVNNTVFVAGSGGNLTSATSQNDWYIKRFYINGTEFNASQGWNKTFDGSGGDDVVTNLAKDSRDNIYAVGYSTNLVSGTSGEDWWIKKFDLNGTEDTTFWNLTFDGNNGGDRPQYAIVNSSDQLFVAGYGTNIVFPATSSLDWWIKSFDGNDPICGVINSDTYLERNISSQTSCIQFNASNIILDCQGHTITYGTAGTVGNAINASNVDNITIKNCNIVEGSSASAGPKYAIEFKDTNNVTIDNNTINTFSSQGTGIYLQANALNIKNINISNNKVSVGGNFARGIFLTTQSGFQTIQNSSIKNNKVFQLNKTGTISPAIDFYFATNNSVRSNNITAYGSSTQGIYLNRASNNHILSNNVTTHNTSAYGVYILGGNYNNISYNNILTSGASAQPIRLNTQGGTNNPEYNTLFKNNITTYASEGIYLTTGSHFTRILDNNITSNYVGSNIRVDISDNTTIKDNIIKNNVGGSGIWFLTSQNNSIINNNITIVGTFATNSIGISMSGSQYTLMNNNISSGYYEISSTATSNTFIYNNSFGEIRWTNTSFLNNLTINTTRGIGLGLNIFIGNNTASVNTSEFYPTGWQINSSANITLRNLAYANVNEIRTVGTYNLTSGSIIDNGVDCVGSSCNILSYTGNTLVFNTTHFSSFAATSTTTVPAVIFVNPTTGTNYTSQMQAFNATVTDAEGVDIVLFMFTTNTTPFNVTATNNSGNWNANIDLSTVVEGTHTITVFANDTVDAVNNTENILINIDRSAPNVNFVNPATGTNFSTQTQTFNATITDLFTSVDTVLFMFTTNTTPFNVTATNNSGNWNASVDLSTIVEGTHTVTVFANDTLNNVNTTQQISINADRSNPLVTIITPTNGSNHSSGIQAFNVTIRDLTIDQVIFVFNNASGNDFNVTATNNSGNWNTNVDLSRLIESNNHNFTVFANDSINNINYTESVWFTVDRTPPNVSLLNTSFTSTIATPNIWVNVTDNLSIVTTCNLYFNGALSSSVIVVNATETAITAGSLSNAAYVVWANCTDYAGNVGNSSNITVTVNVPAAPSSGGSGGGSSGGSSGGGGSAPATTTPTDTNKETTDKTGDLTAEVISETEVTPTEDETEEAQSATSIATREKEVVVEFRNEGDTIIRLRPSIKEEVIARPEIIKKVGPKRAEEIQLIEDENVEFITARTRQFGKDEVCGTTSGIEYSQELVAANPLRASLKNKEEIVVNPGETIDKNFNIQSGIAEQVRGITLIFTADDGQVIEKQIQVSEAQGLGSVVDINPTDAKLDVYMKIPKIKENSETARYYQLEVNINKQGDNKFQPWQTRVPLKLAPTRSALQTVWGEQTAFSELYGTFPVKEKNSKIFAQQLVYNPACYSGTFVVKTKIYEENRVLVEDKYTVNFNTGSISDVQRVNHEEVKGNALTAAAVIIDVPQQDTNWPVMIVMVVMVVLLGIALHFGFKKRRIDENVRDSKIAQLKEMSTQEYKSSPRKVELKKIKEPEAQVEDIKKEIKNLQRSEPIRKSSLNIKEQILEREEREVNRRLHGYPRKTQVLEMPKRKPELDAQLAEIENRLSHLDELGLESAHIKTTLGTPKENKDLADERFRKKELSFVAKNLENPFPEKKREVKSERELIEERLARKEVKRISEKISGQKFSVNNERIRVEEKLKKLKEITK